jgi:hypothetical protein
LVWRVRESKAKEQDITGRCFAETQRVGELGGFGYECLAVGSQHGILWPQGEQQQRVVCVNRPRRRAVER